MAFLKSKKKEEREDFIFLRHRWNIQLYLFCFG